MSNPSVLQYYLGTYVSKNGESYGNVLLKVYSSRIYSYKEALDLMKKRLNSKNFILNIETKLSQVEFEMLENKMSIYQ